MKSVAEKHLLDVKPADNIYGSRGRADGDVTPSIRRGRACQLWSQEA